MAAKIFKMPPKHSDWFPRIYKIIAKNILLALTYFQDGVYKYSWWLPQISKWLPQKFKMAATNIQKSYGRCSNGCHKYLQANLQYFMLIGLSWVTHIHLKTIILAALKRNVMLNLLKLNKLFAKLVYKELARNGKEWHWKGLMKWIAKEMKYLSVN